MSVTYTNRKGDTYYLHQGTTKKGNPNYYFAKKEPDTPVETIPDGYEIYENYKSQVFLRRIRPKHIRDEELAIVDQAVAAHPDISRHLLEVRDKTIFIYTAVQNIDRLRETIATYHPGENIENWLAQILNYDTQLRFTLHDPQQRTFIAERYNFLGSIDDWIQISGPGDLETLVQTFVPHLEQESFYTLY
jgi:hypothetical protein